MILRSKEVEQRKLKIPLESDRKKINICYCCSFAVSSAHMFEAIAFPSRSSQSAFKASITDHSISSKIDTRAHLFQSCGLGLLKELLNRCLCGFNFHGARQLLIINHSVHFAEQRVRFGELADILSRQRVQRQKLSVQDAKIYAFEVSEQLSVQLLRN